MTYPKRYRITPTSLDREIYVPREIVLLIQSYVPLEDLSDSEQKRRVRKISWSTTIPFQDEAWRTTAFEKDGRIYWILHEGNFIHQILEPDIESPGLVFSHSHRSSMVHLGYQDEWLVFKTLPFGSWTLHNFKLFNTRLRPSNLDSVIEYTSKSKFLLDRAHYVLKQVQSLHQTAQIIVSHLHPYDKYAVNFVST